MASKGPVEMSIENDPRDAENIYTVRFAGRQIDTTYVDHTTDGMNAWIREVHRVHHQTGRRGNTAPLVAGLCFFRQRPSFYSRKGPAGNPDHPIRMIAACVGGSHCLVYECWDSEEVLHGLRAFLADRRFKFVGVRIERDAAKLEKEWGVRVTNCVELAPLVETAFGVKLGPVKGYYTGLEEMAKVALGGMEVESKPAKVVECDWYQPSVEQIMYACADAFLAFQIGSKCLDRSNNGRRHLIS